MPGERREASLKFKIEEIEGFLDALKRVEAALGRIHQLSTTPIGVGGTPSSPSAPISPASGGYAPSYGGGATFSAADPGVPLALPAGVPSPQQARIGFAAAGYAAAYSTPTTAAYAPALPGSGYGPPALPPPGGTVAPGQGPQWSGSTAIVPYQGPEASLKAPWWQRQFNMPAWLNVDSFAKMYAGHWAVSRGMEWAQPGVAASAMYERGYYVAPEDASIRSLRYGTMGLSLAVGGPVGGGIGYGLGQGIGGFREQIGGAELERTKDLRLMSELAGLRSGADTGFIGNLVSQQLIPDSSRGLLDKVANLLSYGTPGGRRQTAILETGATLTGLQDVIPGLGAAMEGNPALASGFGGFAKWLKDTTGGNRKAVEAGLKRLASNPGMFWHAAAPFLSSEVGPMFRGPRTAGVTAIRLAATGDLQGLADIAPYATLPGDAWETAWQTAGYEWEAGYQQTRAQEWGPAAAVRQARGGSPESVREARMRVVGAQRRGWSALGAEREQLRHAWSVARQQPGYSTAEEQGWNLDYARLNARLGGLAAAATTGQKEAGLEWIGERAGIFGAEAQLAELEGRSPSSYMSSQAGIYGQVDAAIGRGAGLTPRERAEYTLRRRGAEIGAVESQMRYTGGVAGSRQRLAESRLSTMQAGGAIWSPEMNTAFEGVSKHISERIGAINTAIDSYAAIGIRHGAKIEALQAEKGELGAALHQLQARAFSTAYQTMQVPIGALSQRGDIGTGRVTALGGNVGELGAPFALQTAGATQQVALAERKHADATRIFGPNSTHTIQAGVELEQARAQQAVLPFQQIETRYNQAMRVPTAMSAGYVSVQSAALLRGGSAAAVPAMLAGLAFGQQQVGLFGDRLTEVRRALGGPALVAEAWQDLQSAQSRLAHDYVNAAQFTASPGAEERLEQARFGQQVLQSVMSARGSVRAMARERMGAAEEMMGELQQQKAAVLARTPANMRAAVEHQFNRQARSIQMERVSAEQELQQGWLERVVSATWNMPGNADLVLNEFNYAGAVMKGGVKARHLGSTSADLGGYLEQGMAYSSYGGEGRFGMRESFLENALSRVSDAGSDVPYSAPGLRMPAGAPGSSTAPSFGGSGAFSGEITVRVIVQDHSGNVLGTGQSTMRTMDEFGISIVTPHLFGIHSQSV